MPSADGLREVKRFHQSTSASASSSATSGLLGGASAARLMKAGGRSSRGSTNHNNTSSSSTSTSTLRRTAAAAAGGGGRNSTNNNINGSSSCSGGGDDYSAFVHPTFNPPPTISASHKAQLLAIEKEVLALVPDPTNVPMPKTAAISSSSSANTTATKNARTISNGGGGVVGKASSLSLSAVDGRGAPTATNNQPEVIEVVSSFPTQTVITGALMPRKRSSAFGDTDDGKGRCYDENGAQLDDEAEDNDNDEKAIIHPLLRGAAAHGGGGDEESSRSSQQNQPSSSASDYTAGNFVASGVMALSNQSLHHSQSSLKGSFAGKAGKPPRPPSFYNNKGGGGPPLVVGASCSSVAAAAQATQAASLATILPPLLNLPSGGAHYHYNSSALSSPFRNQNNSPYPTGRSGGDPHYNPNSPLNSPSSASSPAAVRYHEELPRIYGIHGTKDIIDRMTEPIVTKTMRRGLYNDDDDTPPPPRGDENACVPSSSSGEPTCATTPPTRQRSQSHLSAALLNAKSREEEAAAAAANKLIKDSNNRHFDGDDDAGKGEEALHHPCVMVADNDTLAALGERVVDKRTAAAASAMGGGGGKHLLIAGGLSSMRVRSTFQKYFPRHNEEDEGEDANDDDNDDGAVGADGGRKSRSLSRTQQQLHHDAMSPNGRGIANAMATTKYDRKPKRSGGVGGGNEGGEEDEDEDDTIVAVRNAILDQQAHHKHAFLSALRNARRIEIVTGIQKGIPPHYLGANALQFVSEEERLYIEGRDREIEANRQVVKDVVAVSPSGNGGEGVGEHDKQHNNGIVNNSASSASPTTTTTTTTASLLSLPPITKPKPVKKWGGKALFLQQFADVIRQNGLGVNNGSSASQRSHLNSAASGGAGGGTSLLSSTAVAMQMAYTGKPPSAAMSMGGGGGSPSSLNRPLIGSRGTVIGSAGSVGFGGIGGGDMSVGSAGGGLLSSPLNTTNNGLLFPNNQQGMITTPPPTAATAAAPATAPAAEGAINAGLKPLPADLVRSAYSPIRHIRLIRVDVFIDVAREKHIYALIAKLNKSLRSGKRLSKGARDDISNRINNLLKTEEFSAELAMPKLRAEVQSSLGPSLTPLVEMDVSMFTSVYRIINGQLVQWTSKQQEREQQQLLRRQSQYQQQQKAAAAATASGSSPQHPHGGGSISGMGGSHDQHPHWNHQHHQHSSSASDPFMTSASSHHHLHNPSLPYSESYVAPTRLETLLHTSLALPQGTVLSPPNIAENVVLVTGGAYRNANSNGGGGAEGGPVAMSLFLSSSQKYGGVIPMGIFTGSGMNSTTSPHGGRKPSIIFPPIAMPNSTTGALNVGSGGGAQSSGGGGAFGEGGKTGGSGGNTPTDDGGNKSNKAGNNTNNINSDGGGGGGGGIFARRCCFVCIQAPSQSVPEDIIDRALTALLFAMNTRNPTETRIASAVDCTAIMPELLSAVEHHKSTFFSAADSSGIGKGKYRGIGVAAADIAGGGGGGGANNNSTSKALASAQQQHQLSESTADANKHNKQQGANEGAWDAFEEDDRRATLLNLSDANVLEVLARETETVRLRFIQKPAKESPRRHAESAAKEELLPQYMLTDEDIILRGIGKGGALEKAAQYTSHATQVTKSYFGAVENQRLQRRLEMLREPEPEYAPVAAQHLQLPIHEVL